MEYNYNDGGNPKGVNDCVARALAISLNKPYYEIAQTLAPFTQQGGVNIWAAGFLNYMKAQGFEYVLSHVETCNVMSLVNDCIAHTTRHYTAVVSGVVNDTLDTRLETIRGYWVRGRLFDVIHTGNIKINSTPMNFLQASAMRRMYALNYGRKTEIQAHESAE